jgi:3-hydroxyisobutyrate dehydrogenase-like beta-hydroxyacid dehydrogenase
MSRVAVVGLGAMGGRIARRLLRTVDPLLTMEEVESISVIALVHPRASAYSLENFNERNPGLRGHG